MSTLIEQLFHFSIMVGMYYASPFSSNGRDSVRLFSCIDPKKGKRPNDVWKFGVLRCSCVVSNRDSWRSLGRISRVMVGHDHVAVEERVVRKCTAVDYRTL